MTARHAGYLVTLDHDIREDDAEEIIAALRMVKGVLTVEPITASLDLQIAENRARADLQQKLWDVVFKPQVRS